MRETTVDELAGAIERGEALIDVRELPEYRRGHVPGAVNIPVGELPGRIDEIDPATPVHVVCATGNRSRASVHVLTAAGYDAANVVGGTNAWVQAGHPVVRGAGR